jgi:hypothetical protein
MIFSRNYHAAITTSRAHPVKLPVIEETTSSGKERDMNHISGIVLIALGLGVLGETGTAQNLGRAALQNYGPPLQNNTIPDFAVPDRSASEKSNCKKARGHFVEFWGGGNDFTGKLTNGGWLDGTTLVVLTSVGFPTPVPSAFSYTGDHTLTTSRGELKGTRLFTSDLSTGWGFDMTNIDPNASTGIFAGATGVLYVYLTESNTDPPPTSYVNEIRGLVCFAPGMEQRDR